MYDKTGLDELAQALHAAGVEIVSTGSHRADRSRRAGVPVTRVEELTGFPETPRRPGQDAAPARSTPGCSPTCGCRPTSEQLAELGIEPFDLLVCNLYPFPQTVASGASADECVEQIDIGGPAMVRAAAKNHPSVAVVTAVAAYPLVVEALADGGFTLTQRQRSPPAPSRTSPSTTSRWPTGAPTTPGAERDVAGVRRARR